MGDEVGRRIGVGCFPTPDLVKDRLNPAAWDQLGGFAGLQAVEADAALALLDGELGRAATVAARVGAFEKAYKHVAAWRYQVAAHGRWMRPGSNPDHIRIPIAEYMQYRLSPKVGRRQPGSPAFVLLTELERVALERLDGAKRLQNVVRMRDGRRANGNLLLRVQAPTDQTTRRFYPDGLPDEVRTQTAANEYREVLRRASFEVLAELEGRRAEGGRLDPRDPELRQAFSDAAYFLVQGPEFKRGTDAIMRTFLVAAHTRVFDAAPVLPQAIDLDGMVRGQDGFNAVMREQLGVLPQSTEQSRTPQQASPWRGPKIGRQSRETGR